LNPTEPFNLYLQVAFVAGLFAASPFVFYQLWLFIAPGLHRSERRYVLPFLFCTVGLFVAGGLFGYKMGLSGLPGFPDWLRRTLSTNDYGWRVYEAICHNHHRFFGLMFEMPILVFFLTFMRVVTAGWMWRNLRYSILVIFVLAAVITPTADILTMCLFAAPMVALYAISIGVAWLVRSRRNRPAEVVQPALRFHRASGCFSPWHLSVRSVVSTKSNFSEIVE